MRHLAAIIILLFIAGHAFAQIYLSSGIFFRGSLGGLSVSGDGRLDYGGFAYGAAAGMDFPVSDGSALGFALALRASAASYDDSDYKGDWTLFMPAVRFQGTFFGR